MTKSTRIQVMADATLADNVAQYMEAKGVSQSQAGKELMALGYRVWQQDDEASSDELTAMDALKLILKSSYGIQTFLNSTASKHLEKSNNDGGDPFPTAPLIKAANRIASDKVDELFGAECSPDE